MRFSIIGLVVVLVLTSTDAALRSRKRSKRSQPLVAIAMRKIPTSSRYPSDDDDSKS